MKLKHVVSLIGIIIAGLALTFSFFQKLY
ncbi:hypothetical protein SCA_0986 [Staphylococcus carnosus subsp. carnosus TM300]|uniref:Uncharacterized protein n=1 Tax=Staphylococcus carnosus (strain TM300) TaxID=396513 RepID=B9DP75_STACT|nr:hypothetical protein SCA_0986 [Staphylococcus carnosus subsp. carnosus TM300]